MEIAALHFRRKMRYVMSTVIPLIMNQSPVSRATRLELSSSSSRTRVASRPICLRTFFNSRMGSASIAADVLFND